MKNKFKYLILLIMLIPIVTNAKLNEMEFISEKSIPGKVINTEDTTLYLNDNKASLYDYAGNRIKEFPYDPSYEVKYFFDQKVFVLYNNINGNIIFKDHDFNDLYKSTVIKSSSTENMEILDNHFILRTYNNKGFYDVYIYDDKLTLETTINEAPMEIIKITKDAIYFDEIQYEELTSSSPKIRKTYLIIFDKKGKIISNEPLPFLENKFISPYILDNGDIVTYDDNKDIINVYNKDTYEINKSMNNIEEFEVIDDNIYIITNEHLNKVFDVLDKYQGQRDLIDDLENAIKEIHKIKIPIYDLNMNVIGETNYATYFSKLEPDIINEIKIPDYEIMQKLESQNIEANIIYAVEYRNEYYVLISDQYGEERLLHYSKDLEEVEEKDLYLKNVPMDYIIKPYYITVDKNDIVVISKIEPRPTSVKPNGSNEEDYPLDYLNTVIYQRYKINGTPYKINTQIMGEGNIIIPESSQPNEEITFKVNSETGYNLETIYLVDSKGNKTILKDNKFIMPEEDVTIYTVFNVINPETKTYRSLFILGFISFFIVLFLFSRINKVKKYDYL